MSVRASPLTVAIAQMNSHMGDVAGNEARLAEMIGRAREAGAALIVFPELALSGYPPEDLLLKTHFLEAVGEALERLAARTTGIAALVGFPEHADDVYNAAAVLADGRVQAVYRKMTLPNYGVFDEKRYFQVGTHPALIEVNEVAVGLTICEDIWDAGPPAVDEALAGARVIVNLSASPYHAGKGFERERMLIQRAHDNLCPVIFCNMVGGQDELVFDGHSLAIDQDGRVLARAPQFAEALTVATIDPGAVALRRLQDTRHREAVQRARERAEAVEPLVPVVAPLTVELEGSPGKARTGGEVTEPMSPEEEVYSALVTGLRDYVDKNGFGHVVFGLSGGIDSALVALVAADALGPGRVTCAAMPSPYSSEGTRRDARAVGENLAVDLVELDIGAAMKAYDELLQDVFQGREPDIAEENIQARIRGNLVMALANKFGWLALATGNKSELSVGYATLYGDMAGGFAVLKDVFKGWVYRLVRWRNEREGRELVPGSVLDRPPSAELRYEQRDDQSPPPYEVLDRILEGYVERDLGPTELVRAGLAEADVERVVTMVDRAEHKRRQAPPGIRISAKAFGRDRRLPITNRFAG